MAKNPVLEFLRDSFDEYDPWGSALGAHFDIAECLYRHDQEIPEWWEFRPSPLLDAGDTFDPEWEGYFAAGLEAWATGDLPFWAHPDSKATFDDMRHAGNVLARYCNLLRLAGKDY